MISQSRIPSSHRQETHCSTPRRFCKPCCTGWKVSPKSSGDGSTSLAFIGQRLFGLDNEAGCWCTTIKEISQGLGSWFNSTLSHLRDNNEAEILTSSQEDFLARIRITFPLGETPSLLSRIIFTNTEIIGGQKP